MSNYQALTTLIRSKVFQNSLNQITGTGNQQALLAMVESLGAGYQLIGVATPQTNPGSPDYKCFYIAPPGEYPNFGTGITVAEGEVAILKWDTAWHKEVTGAASAALVTELGQEVSALSLGKFYGFIDSTDNLPGGDLPGYAYVGTSSPFAIYNFDGTSWSNSGSVYTYPIADGEDIDTDSQDRLKFANRANTDGLGYVILRKNTSISSQLTQNNTIYEIRYDFDLSNGTLTVPSNSTLRFVGGKISNGTIVGDDTKIEAGLVQIFGSDVVTSGSFILDKVYPEWFGAVGLSYQVAGNPEALHPAQLELPAAADDLSDSAPAINAAIALASISSCIVSIQGAIYRIATMVDILKNITITTDEHTIFDVRMHGSGAKKIVQNLQTGAYTTENFSGISLKRNELFELSSMAVAFRISSVRTKFVGRGTITMVNSDHTIGILAPGTGYEHLDMSFESPYIDMRTVGDVMSRVAPDSRDLVGSVDPTASVGSNNDFYWNTTDRTYWFKSNGTWAQWKPNALTGNLFNVSLRFEIQSDYGTGRIIRPKIRLWDTAGWRGIEIYTYGNGWMNDGWWEGSISYKHGSAISIFAVAGLGYIDMSPITCQTTGLEQNDSSGFFAFNCQDILLPRFWDLNYIKPARVGKEYIYLGLATTRCVAQLDTPERYYTDLGYQNRSNYKDPFNTDPRSLVSLQFENIFKYRSPVNVGATTLGKLVYFDQPYEDLKSASQAYQAASSSVAPPAVLFDEQHDTYDTVIDTASGKYGVAFFIGTNNTLFEVPADSGFLEVEFTIFGATVLGDIRLGVTSVTNEEAVLKNFVSGGGERFSQKVIIPLEYAGYSHSTALFIFITSNKPNVSVRLFNVKFFRRMYRLDNTTKPTVGLRSKMPNSLPCGACYFATDTKQMFVNMGTTDSPNLTTFSLDGTPKARFVNNNPGSPMTWLNSAGQVASSIETEVEVSDVKGISQNLFKSNTTIKRIETYPLSLASGTNLADVFAGCSNLEYLCPINVSAGTSFLRFLAGCSKLKEVPALDTSAAVVAGLMFNGCTALETIPLLDWSHVTVFANGSPFQGCSALKNLAGFSGLAISVSLEWSPLLTTVSVQNLFNNLATVQTTQSITLHHDVYDALGAGVLAIATGKGWSVIRK